MNLLTELVPVFAILLLTLVLVSQLSVDQEYYQVEHIEVGQDAVETAGQAPSESHENVSDVVWVAADSPETGDYEFRAALGWQRLEVPHGGMVGVTSECILLGVRPTEDDEPKGVQAENCHGPPDGKFGGMVDKVPSLQAVDKRDPG